MCLLSWPGRNRDRRLILNWFRRNRNGKIHDGNGEEPNSICTMLGLMQQIKDEPGGSDVLSRRRLGEQETRRSAGTKPSQPSRWQYPSYLALRQNPTE